MPITGHDVERVRCFHCNERNVIIKSTSIQKDPGNGEYVVKLNMKCSEQNHSFCTMYRLQVEGVYTRTYGTD